MRNKELIEEIKKYKSLVKNGVYIQMIPGKLFCKKFTSTDVNKDKETLLELLNERGRRVNALHNQMAELIID